MLIAIQAAKHVHLTLAVLAERVRAPPAVRALLNSVTAGANVIGTASGLAL